MAEAKPSRLVVVVLAGIAAVSCGDPSEQLASETVVVEGSIFTDFHVDISCDEYSAQESSMPEELSGVALTISNGTGAIVGRTSTGTLQWSTLDDGCRFYASYQVTVPVAPVYRVDFDPLPPKESGFFGAEELATQQVSFEELEGDGFRWDFEAPPTYVVADPPCAFDDTGCLAADLVITVARDDGASASLIATAGIEANSWAREGITADGGIDTVASSLGDPAEFPTVAPRFELSVTGDPDGAEVLVHDLGGDETRESASLLTLELETGLREWVTLPAGTYILSVTVPGSSSGIHFGIRIP